MRRAGLKRLVSTAGQALLEALRAQPYAQLAQLPARTSEDISGGKAQLSIYRDELEAGRLRIVVQGIVPGWLGSAFVRAWGFTLEPSGSPTTLADEALWDFT
jgi:hypothetical protein